MRECFDAVKATKSNTAQTEINLTPNKEHLFNATKNNEGEEEKTRFPKHKNEEIRTWSGTIMASSNTFN